MITVIHKPAWFSSDDLHWFNEGTHSRIYEKFGAQLTSQNGSTGVHFAVWAPNAERVSVIGNFNSWSKSKNLLQAIGASGVWAGFVPEIARGTTYKYHIVSRYDGYEVDKADPVGFRQETAPKTASLVWDLEYAWQDRNWMKVRGQRQNLSQPTSIYEVHLGSWMRLPEEGNRWLTYRESAPRLAEYVQRLGFTHVEFLPVMKHPFYGSWGYQTTCYYAPTGRYGTPQDLMYLIDYLHQHEIGVILDWVPSHFPADEYGLAYFDGTHLYEHGDPRQGVQPDWHSYIFNYGRHEVHSFLLSNALFWLDKYHADGLRVDAVASMLYLDYSRKPGEWIPNRFGGRENLEAIDFLRRLNETIYREYPDVQTCAEESTAWPMVSRPLYVGGLGFGYKWDMGFMHDTLSYFSKEPVHRKYHHSQITFRAMYAFSENFILPFSHDEVVYGKGSLLAKMPGDDWQRFANLRLLFAYLFLQPGKKLLFMGDEFGQRNEWNHETSLDWRLLQFPPHAGVQRLVSDLNRLYRGQPALHECDTSPDGFAWVDCNDSEQSTLSWLRRGTQPDDTVVSVFNFTPVVRHNFRVGLPQGGFWSELLNTDAADYGGSGQGNLGGLEAAPFSWHGQPNTFSITLPPLGAVCFKRAQS
ncbi:MAG TPA: 1,4-alpha-glucan branching protein GlgB [Verrucomicrobiae bacterium]|nr:1,4-alpha-glucan branching protein GlgB [Verrucomicrobiae bacterium]